MNMFRSVVENGQIKRVFESIVMVVF